jgi:cation diffusion facilitator family transporter
MAETREARESLTSIVVALVANLGIAIAKGTAAVLTASPALLAETLHTLADAGNEVLLAVALRRGARPPDESHPLGYGTEVYFWALLAAIGMFVVGGAISVYRGVEALIHPEPLESFWVGVAVLVLALTLDSISRVVASRRLRAQARRRGLSVRDTIRETADPTLVTVYAEDTIDVIGAALALVALIAHKVTGSAIPDALATIVIGLLLVVVAWRLADRDRALLAHQAVPERYVAQLRRRLESEPGIVEVRELRVVYLAPGQVLAVGDVHVAQGSPVDVLARVRNEICREIPALAWLYLQPV